MDVWRVEAAGADEADGHGDAGSDQRWEEFAVGFDGVASLACGDGVGGWGVVEVVFEVRGG